MSSNKTFICLKHLLVLCLFILTSLSAVAKTFTISGTVTNKKGQKLQSATVFIAGSQKIMAAGDDGKFEFEVGNGIYQVVVTLMGYNSQRKTIVLNKQNVVADFELVESDIALNEVTIREQPSKKRKSQIALFTRHFLGNSANSKDCKILNTELLRFTEDKKSLYATTNDFLIVENKALGYRIKYLVQFFRVAFDESTYFYDGDYSFEPMLGTPEQQARWAINRKMAYEGSMMHYLRSVFAGTARSQGFLLYQIVNYIAPTFQFKPTPIFQDQVIKKIDDKLAEFRFGDNYFYVLYDKDRAAKPDKKVADEQINRLSQTEKTGSVYKIHGKFDSQGSLEEYDKRSFWVSGFMTKKRVADQLPYEYNPE